MREGLSRAGALPLLEVARLHLHGVTPKLEVKYLAAMNCSAQAVHIALGLRQHNVSSAEGLKVTCMHIASAGTLWKGDTWKNVLPFLASKISGSVSVRDQWRNRNEKDMAHCDAGWPRAYSQHNTSANYGEECPGTAPRWAATDDAPANDAET